MEINTNILNLTAYWKRLVKKWGMTQTCGQTETHKYISSSRLELGKLLMFSLDESTN